MSAAPEQRPRAADVPEAVDLTNIPPAVLTAIYDEFGCLRRNSPTLAAIATALREAKEQGAADTARLREFAATIIRRECWDFVEPDGGDVQDLAEHLGLITAIEVAAPCGEHCNCAWHDADFPARCYRLTWELDAARAAEPEAPVTREDGR